MLSVHIDDVKKLTAMLFTKDAFDRFETYTAVTVNRWQTVIDGKMSAGNPEGEKAPDTLRYIPWKEIRPVLFETVKGNVLPSYFKIVLITSEKSTEWITEKSGFMKGGLSSCSMNLLWQNNELTLTSGISYTAFTLDKSAENFWDETVRKFLTDQEIAFH